MYIIEGPKVIGNIFGYFGKEVPEGKFAVVENGEYANGGNGPSQAVKGLFDSEEEASRALEREQLCQHEWHYYGSVNGVADYGCQKCGATRHD